MTDHEKLLKYCDYFLDLAEETLEKTAKKKPAANSKAKNRGTVDTKFPFAKNKKDKKDQKDSTDPKKKKSDKK